MATWKRLLTDNDLANTNIGSNDLTINPSTTRTLSFGDASSKFRVKNNANKLLLVLHETTARLGSNVSTATLELQTSGSTLTMASDNTVLFDKTNKLTIESEDTGATQSPTLELFRNSTSPADDDIIGAIDFKGEDSSGSSEVYARIEGKIEDVTNNTEDGELAFYVRNGGASGAGDEQLKNAFHIDGTNLNVNVKIEQDLLQVRSLRDDGAASPELRLWRDSVSPVVDDILGSVSFYGENANGDIHEYAKIHSRIHDTTTGSEDGKISFHVHEGGSSVKCLELFPKEPVSTFGGGFNNYTKTEAMRKLESVQVHSANLSTLSNRFMHTFHAGSATEIVCPTNNGVINHNLKGINGVQFRTNNSTTHSTDSDFNKALGHVMPFDGYIRSLSLGYRKSGGSATSASVKLIARVYQVNNTSTSKEFTLELSGSGETNKSNPSKTANFDIYDYSFSDNPSHHVGKNFFRQGDKIVLYVKAQSLSANKDYKIDDMVACMTVYSEDF